MFKSEGTQISRQQPAASRLVTFGQAAFSLGFIGIGLGIWAILGAAAPPPPGAGPGGPGGPGAGPSPVVQLGQALFVDASLSNPKGQSCISCHSPAAGWTFPDSEINQMFGPVPGAVDGRFGNRRPPTISYAVFMKEGPPTFNQELQAYAGGFFYDGRAPDLEEQVLGPLQNPNEMNNTPAGVVAAVADGPQAALFRQAYGVNINSLSVEEAFVDIAEAIAAYEATPALSPFNSKYDAYVAGHAQLTAAEKAGLQLFTGTTTGRPGGPAAAKSANCIACHAISSDPGESPDLFTANGFYNIGMPKNPGNPYYTETNASTDPEGYNPLGAAYIDYGLGDFLYPQDSLPSGNTGTGSNGRGDYLRIDGTFKTPTLRNVDTRPTPDFIKCYGHNGYFKSLAQVVHFHNTRSLTTVAGEVINFTKSNPYAGLKGKPLWPAPEYASSATMVNPTGARAGLIGNLGLTAADEANLVAFLQTLSDAPPPPTEVPPPQAAAPPTAPTPPESEDPPTPPASPPPPVQQAPPVTPKPTPPPPPEAAPSPAPPESEEPLEPPTTPPEPPESPEPPTHPESPTPPPNAAPPPPLR